MLYVAGPIACESQHGLGDTNFKYWTILAMLHYHPWYVDFHPEYFVSELAETRAWAQAHLGVTRANTPSAWTVLRDREYEPQTWDNGREGISGKNGDWTFWLYRVSGGARVWERELPAGRGHAAARQCRATRDARAMTFEIDSEFARLRGANGYVIRVTLLDYGADRLALRYARKDGGLIERYVSKSGSNTWRVLEWDCPDMGGTMFELYDALDGIEYVHKIEVIPSKSTL
jgi:hypothetical protein